MHEPLLLYVKRQYRSCSTAIVNMCMFLPYFFSVPALLRTLFAPWKNIKPQSTKQGFSFSQWGDQMAALLISRTMGFIMRSSILIFYVMIQVSFIILIPFIVLLFTLVIIPEYFVYQLQMTEEEKIKQKEDAFVSSHCLDSLHTDMVRTWFLQTYRPLFLHSAWWDIHNLFSVPPLGRDWASGYTPTLEQYCEDLCDSAYQSRIPIVYGRVEEMKLIEETLIKNQEANIIVVGEAGVGKHTLLQGFARRVYLGQINHLLMYKRILKLNMEKIISQYPTPSQREEFLNMLLKEAETAGNIILFIDHIERYTNLLDEHNDLSTVFEKYGKTASLSFIGVTTPQAYETFLFPNETIRQLFTKITVHEMSPAEAHRIILQQTPAFEARHQVVVPYETTKEILEKSDYYITSIPFPEKALQLLEEGCIYTKQTIKKTTVLPQYIDIVLSSKTHIPTSLTTSLKETLLHLESMLAQHIIDQPFAISTVSATMRRAFLLIGKRKKPLASLLFTGPTGVGKTETAKTLCELVFQDPQCLIRFDMSLYQTKQDIHMLIGSSELHTPGLLTQALREKPYGVLLLDEIEKADVNLKNIFLTLLDEGYFTDGEGKRVDCKHVIVIATTNAVTHTTQSDSSNTSTVISQLVNSGVFAPEFLNRFDGIIPFAPLSNNAALHIARYIAGIIIKEIADTQKITITISDTSLQSIIQNSYNSQFGARDVERVLRAAIEDTIAKKVLSGELHEGQTVQL